MKWLLPERVLEDFSYTAQYEPARCRTRILVTYAAFTQIARATLGGKERNGGFHTFLRSLGSALCQFFCGDTLGQSLFGCIHSRRQCINHGLFARICFTPSYYTSQEGFKHGYDIRGIEFSFTRDCCTST